MWIAAPSSSVGTAGVADSKVAEKWGKCNNATPTNHCLTAAAAVQPVQYSKCHHPTPVKRALNSHQDYQLWTILLTSELWAWCQAQPPSSSFSSPSPSTGKFMLLNHSSIFSPPAQVPKKSWSTRANLCWEEPKTGGKNDPWWYSQ